MSDAPVRAPRLREAAAAFERAYGAPPGFLVAAPGRVNLLGEHTDYNGLPVLPMALQRRIYVLGAPRRGGMVHLTHLDGPSEGSPRADEPAPAGGPAYGPRSFRAAPPIPPYPTGDWGNYAKAAVQGVVEAGMALEGSGADLLVWADLPPAAGLSSSSALVVACALALLHAAGREPDRLALAETLAAAEHYVGTQGGGMDQAACLLGKPGHALRIDFRPLRAAPVPLPHGCAVVVSHSLVRAPKTESALLEYNRGPAECRLAAALLSRRLHGDAPPGSQRPLLADLLRETPHLLEVAGEVFGERGWTLSQAAEALGTTPDRVAAEHLMAAAGRPLPEPPEGFPLLRRVRHVITEAQRVEAATEAGGRGDGESFGRLMNASHGSCARDYGISTPELDALAAAARDAGALGSRLTGAGFGGCVVSLVPVERLPAFLDQVRRRYYEEYLGERRPDLLRAVIAWEDVLFAAEASASAQVLDL